MNSLVLEQLRPRPLYYMTHRQLSAADMPVGDPLGGPAYGEKRGPALAIFGAYSAISAGIAIGAGTLMGGLMIAGGVMSGLGAITGNKTLSTLGMVAGLAGGVGQFFQQGGFDSFSQAYQADGIQGITDQFTGNVDYSYGYPGNDVPPIDAMGGAMDPASQALNQVENVSAAQQFLSQGSGVPTGSIDSGAGAIPGSSPSSGVNIPIPGGGAPSADATKSKEGGLLGLWKNSGDFTKMAVINAGAGALKGMGESSAAEEKAAAEREMFDETMSLKKTQTEASNELTAAQTEAIEKKNAGVPMVDIGKFGANQSEAFGKNANGQSRTYAEYIADRTDAMKRLFGTQQTVAA
jgi:hypothetical protein